MNVTNSHLKTHQCLQLEDGQLVLAHHLIQPKTATFPPSKNNVNAHAHRMSSLVD